MPRPGKEENILSKKNRHTDRPSRKAYERDLRELQIAFGHLQRRAVERELRVCLVFEGRDAAGKDGTIKRITENLPPREVRAVALPKPNDRDRASWYFQRYVPHLPARGEMVLFNRSWYNRAGVEPVMEFCTPAQNKTFLHAAPKFEQMLVEDGIVLLKYWLDITKSEQKARLDARKNDPLKTWKLSPLDAYAQSRWEAYSAARDAMLQNTDHKDGPWRVVRAEEKRTARLNIMRDILHQLAPDLLESAGKQNVDRDIVRGFADGVAGAGFLAP